MIQIVQEALSQTDDQEVGPSGDVVAALIRASGGPDHIVHMQGRDNFTMQHPITERFAQPGVDAHLFHCNVFQLARIAAAQGAFSRTGRYRVWVDRGVLETEEL